MVRVRLLCSPLKKRLKSGRRLCKCWGQRRTKNMLSVDNGEVHESFTGTKDEYDNNVEEMAAIRIQTAFRGHLTRRGLNGRARLKSFVGGQYAEREVASASKCIQMMAHLQSHHLLGFMQTWRNAVNTTFMDPYNPCWEWRWSKGLKWDPVPTMNNAVCGGADNLVPTKNVPCTKPRHQILSNSAKQCSPTTLKGSASGINEEHTSLYTANSDGCQRRRLSARDDASLTSCPSVPCRRYMASTASSRAKARLRSPLGTRRRLTFPVDG